MPLPVIDRTCRVAVRGFQANGKPWVNVAHLHKDSAGVITAADIALVDAQFVKFYIGPAAGGGNYWLSRMALGATLQDITYTPLDGVSPSVVISHVTASGGGAAAVPGEVACVLTLRTAIRGRRYRGRLYLPGLDKALLNNSGTMAATVPANATLQAAGVNALMIAINWSWVVASYVGLVANSVQSFTMNDVPDVQRRRK